MCSATGVAIASLALSAGSSIMGAQAQEAEINRQYNRALTEKSLADQASSAKLRADRDALNRKSLAEREKGMRDSMTIQRTSLQDQGAATAAASAKGVSGAGMGEIVTALYRSKNEATDVAALNNETAQANINANLASAQTTHNYQLASNIPTRGNGTSGLAMAIDIGKSGIDAIGTYKSLSGKMPWQDEIGSVIERDLTD